MTHPFPPKTTLAILASVAFLAAPDLIPKFPFKLIDWNNVAQVADFVPLDAGAPAEEAKAAPVRSVELNPLRDVRGNLDHFYEALHRTERGEPGAATRIVHYGDSPTTADLITADARSLFQKQFTGAGHGFHLIAKPWAWYEHRGIRVSSEGWIIDPATDPSIRDGVYGLGGVSFRGSPGASATFRLRDPGHTSAEVAYLAMPDGGKFSISADGAEATLIDTNAEAFRAGYARLAFPPHTRELSIAVTEGQVRLFGLSLERDVAGVVYDSLGLNGAYISVLAKMFNEQHWDSQLRHYRPDLVIVNYGTNESVYAEFIDKAYARELKEVIRRIRKAVPEASILVMSPMDRGRREMSGSIDTVPVLPRLVAMQERLAAENGCAFFNTFQAMGGPGTMGRWYRMAPRLVSADFIHPLPAGAKIVGGLLYESLMKGYRQHRQQRTASR